MPENKVVKWHQPSMIKEKILNEIIFRPAGEADISDIHKIEAASFLSPQSVNSLRQELSILFSVFIAAEYRGEVIAFAVAWRVHDEIQLNKIAVHEHYRRMGIGAAFLQYLIDTINHGYAVKMTVEVREKDKNAGNFYRNAGFNETGLRKDYYPDDNAVLMEKEINV